MENNFETKIKIVVFGVGGAGSNIVSSLIDDKMEGLEVVLINTDAQDLNSRSKDVAKVQIGQSTTNGQGAGANPEIGKKAAQESREAIIRHIQGANIVFTVAGFGAGTGTGAGPEIAKIAKESGALSLVLATMPEIHIGQQALDISLEAVKKLDSFADSYTLFSNEKLQSQSLDTSLDDAYNKIDGQITQSIRAIWNIITHTGKINIDLADVKSALSNSGKTIIAMGSATGDQDPEDAVNQAVDDPLFEGTVKGCGRAIVNIVTSPKTNAQTPRRIIDQMKKVSFSQDINITQGLTFDDTLNDEIFVSIIATQLNDEDEISDTYTQRKIADKIKENVTEAALNDMPLEDDDFVLDGEFDIDSKEVDLIPKESSPTFNDSKSNQSASEKPKKELNKSKEIFSETHGGSMYEDTQDLNYTVDNLEDDDDFVSFEDME